MSEAETVARWQVPHSWSWVEIGDICDVIGGGTPSTSEPANFFEGDIPWVTPADLSGYTHKYIESGARAITRRGLEGSGARVLPAGTVLFSSRAPIGYVAIAKNPVATNQGFKSFIPPTGLASDYLYYYLQHAKRLAVELSSGTTFQEISGKRAGQIPLAVAPEAEQPRIVEKLEELFSDLDAGTAALERARANLKRYRAAVLKAAVEGRLTEKWRAAHPDAEPAGKLLERILAERRKKWEEAQLKKYAEKEQAPPKGWKDRYLEPAEPDVSALPELPAGWCWATVEQLSTRVVDGVHKKPSYVPAGVPFITVRNLTAGAGISFEKVRFITAEDHREFSQRAPVEKGDILISKDGTLGVVRLVDTDEVFSIFVSVALVKPVLRNICEYVCWAMKSRVVQAQMVPKGSGLQHIHLEDLRLDCVPVAPLKEQCPIVEELERLNTLISAAEAEIERSQERGSRLRQSLLKSAFEGKLVPQDPKDEPASELLARIRRARADQTVNGGGKIRKKIRQKTRQKSA